MSPTPEPKTGKNPEGKSYEYDRERARRELIKVREWVHEYYGDACSDCGKVVPDWHEPKDSGHEGLTLYHRYYDYWAHVGFVNENSPSGPKSHDQCWGVNLYRWLKARSHDRGDFRGWFVLLCQDCKAQRGLGAS